MEGCIAYLLHQGCCFIISSKTESLSSILRDLKRHTAKEVLRAIEENAQESRREWMRWLLEYAGQRNAHNTTYQFWQQSSHPIELPSTDLRQQRLAYLHRNPVVAGLLAMPEDLLHSSARPSLLEVLLID
ncbi:transposase [Hymenobacter sp. HMF4947]|uniref:Transposase n=1 Tax=Hymenobacter ginkgonis TaxID=2682976 RepID=A0A7K1TGD3_9BACT|nr:transposase [Hymenobacter ginkgonis]MVN77231.1 transposase [Hymenobacter ginkgonis]